MRQELLVFIFDGYADWEPAFVCAELNSPETQYTVKTISLDLSPKVSMGGVRVIPDYSVTDYPRDFALLILTGGYAWLEQKNNAVLPVVEYAVKHQIPVGAICNAANFMAENGFLDSINHTGNTLDFMKATSPHYQGEKYFQEKQAICDSMIITANGTGTLEFSREILTLLKVKSQKDVEDWYSQNKSGFYPAD